MKWGAAVEPQIGVTVGELLGEDLKLNLLGGRAGLGRLVRSVGVMETPDLYPLVKQGDLILTALFAVKDDRDAQLALIPELHRRGAVGLAVKRRYVEHLPAKMLEEAERLGFPLLEIPPDAAFSDVMLPVFRQIVNRQAAVLARQVQAHRAVMQAVLEGRGLTHLAETLAGLLSNPVVIRGAEGEILAVSRVGADRPDVVQVACAPAARTEYLLPGTTDLHRREGVLLGDRSISRTVSPILSGERSCGQILVVESTRRLSDLDLLIVDSVSTVVALELTNQRAVQEVERRYRGEFLVGLFAREIESEEALQERAIAFGLDLRRHHQVLALRMSYPESGDPASLQRLRDQFYATLSRQEPIALVGQAGLYTVALVDAHQVPSDRAREFAAGLLAQSPDGLLVSAGIGRPGMGVQGLRKSYGEACRAVTVGERAWGGRAAYHCDDLGLYQILAQLTLSEDLERFLAAIDKLVVYERDSRTDLIQTLETYFECKGNVRKVSERLFAHYNTVLYRLERIQQITGISLEEAGGRLHLQVALQAARLFGKLPPSKRSGGKGSEAV